jgi:FAD/FMN-containing dehydrogenase
LELLDQRAARAIFASTGVAWPEARWSIVVGYEGNIDAVTWQVQQLVKELGNKHSLVACIGVASASLWDALVHWPGPSGENILFKMSTLPSCVAEFCRNTLAEAGQSSLRAHAGNGIIYLLLNLTGASFSATLKSESMTKPYSMVMVQCPRAWQPIDTCFWSPLPANFWLMNQVKNQFDPRGIFNPGRFVGGI